jgi:thiol-disulfide isomerase/thioredoxin
MKLLIAIILLFQAIMLKAQEYVIEGNIHGILDRTEIILMQNHENVLIGIAKDTIINGKFKFRGNIEGLSKMGIRVMASGFPSMGLDIYVAPGSKTKIMGNNTLLKTWRVESSVKDQIELNRYTKATEKELDRLQELSVYRNTLRKRREKASADVLKKLRSSIDSIDKMQDSIYRSVYKKELVLLAKSPITDVWMNKLNDIARSVKYDKKSVYRQQVTTLFNRLNSTQKASYYGREIQVTLFPPVIIKSGEVVPNEALTDLEGNKHYLSDYKGKYLLIDFWSMACGPCIMAMPELGKLSAAYKDSLTVVSLSMDVKKEVWRKASENHKINWVNLTDGNGMAGIAALFGVEGIPHYALISPEGKLVTSWTGFSEGDLDRRIKNVFQ